MRPKVFITQACTAILDVPRFSRRDYLMPITSLALSLSVFAGGWTWAKNTVQIDAVQYQPEGLVIQLTGGKTKTPNIETWPNMKDGVSTELIVIRMPNCTGNYEAMQQTAMQEVSKHPEIKQFWVTPLNGEKTDSPGLQVVLEVVTSENKREFTPEALSQGDDQWVITLQSVASKLSSNPAQPAQTLTVSSNSTSPEMGADSITTAASAEPEAKTSTRSGWPFHTKKERPAEAGQSDDATQTLLASLSQAKQKQAELGAQVVALQQALAESNAQKDSLQGRLNGYENLLEDTGFDPHSPEKNAQIIIQNLKNALVKVAQKLKIAEEALARQSGNSSAKPAQPVRSLPTRNLVNRQIPDNQAEKTGSQNSQPIAALGLAEASTHPLIQKDETTNSKPATAKIASTNGSMFNVYPGNHPNNPTQHAPVPSQAIATTQTQSSKATLVNTDTTEARLRKALQKNPIQVDNYLGLADYYVARQDWKNAESILLSLTHVQPGGEKGYYYLTVLYLSRQDRKNAQAAMEQYVKLSPKDTQGITMLRKAFQANSTQPAPPAKKLKQTTSTGTKPNGSLATRH